MERIGYWWGIQLIAVTDDEAECLRELARSLRPNALGSYDDGTARLVIGWSDPEAGLEEWQPTVLKHALLTLTLNR